MKKTSSKLATLSLMAAAMAMSSQSSGFGQSNIQGEPTMGAVVDWKPTNYYGRSTPLTKKQIKARAMSKIQRKSRKINRK